MYCSGKKIHLREEMRHKKLQLVIKVVINYINFYIISSIDYYNKML